MFGLGVPFFLPVWRRVAVIAVCVFWGFFEYASGQVFWAAVSWGIGIVAWIGFATADWDAIAASEDDD